MAKPEPTRMNRSLMRSIGTDWNQHWFLLPLTLMVWRSCRDLEAFAVELCTHLALETEKLKVGQRK